MKQILERALFLVSGDRAEMHGDFAQNHANIAALWSAHLGIEITPRDAALLLALLKVARTKCGAHNPDDYVDLCGYAAIAGAIAENEE